MTEVTSPLDRAMRLHTNQPGLIDGDRIMTWGDMQAAVELLQRNLRTLGVRPGDRVAIIENNRLEIPMLILANIRLGAVTVLISPRFPETTRTAMVKSVGARIVTGWDLILRNSETLAKNCAQQMPTSAGLYDTTVTIVFTSGSTGTPKAILHSLGNHYYNALGSNAVLPVGPDDRWLLALPLYHVGGLGILNRCLLGGAAVVFERRGVDMAEQISQDRITHLSLVPTQLRRLLKHPDLKQLSSSLKAILLGGAPIPPNLLRQASDAGLPVYPTYGLTEMASQVATGSPESPDKLRVLPHREVRIADDGTICVRGRTLFLGYVTPNGVELPLDADGWFNTGDIGCIDSDGCLHVSGRKDNLFISGGENIHPEQIEAALVGIEGVDEAVVVPVDDAEYGSRPVAFLRYRHDLNLSETESDLSEETRFGFDHLSLSAELEKTLPRFMLPVVYYPWPHGYTPGGIKLDRIFFRDLAKKLHRNKR